MSAPVLTPMRRPSPEELALIHLSPLSRRFALAAMGYLVAGAALGVLPSVGEVPPLLVKAHIHLLTLGFFTFLIYGLAYHMLPRFQGRVLRQGVLTWGHELFAHLGLGVQTVGWVGNWPLVAAVGGVFSWLGFLAFTLAVWPLLSPRAGGG